MGIGFAKKAPAGWSHISMDAIVIPVYNQNAHTQDCLHGLAPDLAEGVAVVIVNNGSTDGTAEWLDQQAGIKVIHNAGNRDCRPRGNQGCAAAVLAEWTIVILRQ